MKTKILETFLFTAFITLALMVVFVAASHGMAKCESYASNSNELHECLGLK